MSIEGEKLTNVNRGFLSFYTKVLFTELFGSASALKNPLVMPLQTGLKTQKVTSSY